MKTASWVLLALVGVLTLLLSLVSAWRAYGSSGDQIGGRSLGQLAAGRPEVETALRARRATAAAYAVGFAALFLLVSVGPYRRGEVWAWWALLVGMLTVSGVILLRGPLLGIRLSDPAGGSQAALIQLLIVGVGLALGAGRLRRGRPGDSA